MLEDNSATVQLSFGTGKAGKSGHFRRMVAYLEGLTNRSIFWLDHTPSKENPSDIMTGRLKIKSVVWMDTILVVQWRGGGWML